VRCNLQPRGADLASTCEILLQAVSFEERTPLVTQYLPRLASIGSRLSSLPRCSTSSYISCSILFISSYSCRSTAVFYTVRAGLIIIVTLYSIIITKFTTAVLYSIYLNLVL
jgi:hypothetical protein